MDKLLNIRTPLYVYVQSRPSWYNKKGGRERVRKLLPTTKYCSEFYGENDSIY